MPRHIYLEPHLTTDDLKARYRRSRDPAERSHWHFLWLLARGLTATGVARVTGYSAYWVGQIARRYNSDDPEGMCDQRHTAQAGGHPRVLLTSSARTDVRAALPATHPEGDPLVWTHGGRLDWPSPRAGGTPPDRLDQVGMQE